MHTILQLRTACKWAADTHPDVAAMLARVQRHSTPAMREDTLSHLWLTLEGRTTTGGTLRITILRRALILRQFESTGVTGLCLPLPDHLTQPKPEHA